MPACPLFLPAGTYSFKYGFGDQYAAPSSLDPNVRMVLFPGDSEFHERFLVAKDSLRGCYTLTLEDEPLLGVTYPNRLGWEAYLLLQPVQDVEPSCFCFIPQPEDVNLFKIKALDIEVVAEDDAFVVRSPIPTPDPPSLVLLPSSYSELWQITKLDD